MAKAENESSQNRIDIIIRQSHSVFKKNMISASVFKNSKEKC